MTVAVAGVHPLAPGPRGMEVLGLLGSLRRDPLGTMARLRERYGNVYRLAASVGVDTTVLCRPEAAAHVLQHHHKNYRKGAVIGQFKLLDGEGLVTSEGELWTRQRKLAQPAVHRQRLVRMADSMVECTEALAERWRGYARRGDVFDTEPEMMRLTARRWKKTKSWATASGRMPMLAWAPSSSSTTRRSGRTRSDSTRTASRRRRRSSGTPLLSCLSAGARAGASGGTLPCWRRSLRW